MDISKKIAFQPSIFQDIIQKLDLIDTFKGGWNLIENKEKRYLRVHQLYSIILKYSSKDQCYKGQYKNLSNRVVANYPDGEQKVIFRTTEPHLTANEIHNLIVWTNKQLEEKKLHPVLITSVFVYEFLSIHPYQDGNGRLSRLLTTFLLLKQDYNFIEYVSFEHVIENRKDMYYRVFMETQKHRGLDDEILDRWVIFFLDCLIDLTEKLKTKYETYNSLKASTNDRQKQVLDYIDKNKTIQIKDLEEGLVLTTGSGCGVRYHAKE